MATDGKIGAMMGGDQEVQLPREEKGMKKRAREVRGAQLMTRQTQAREEESLSSGR